MVPLLLPHGLCTGRVTGACVPGTAYRCGEGGSRGRQGWVRGKLLMKRT